MKDCNFIDLEHPVMRLTNRRNAGLRRCLLMLLSLLTVIPVLAEEHLKPIDRVLPAFSLESVDGQSWAESSLQGKPWVINFWATWCPPCIEELPSMNAAWDVLEPAGVGMLAINAGEGRQAVEDFLQRVAIDFPTILGDGDSLPNWSVRALPTTIVVDAEGQVIYEALGPREWDDADLLARIVELVR